ncbi:MAG: tRNA (adenosine(37)-N6)-dimethylallyltransferase MiaA, partial [Myxococcales bacterium]|nr:tRNA (adenosine(37)-N6)-dimethylallyltransferase MiaA [Myxococcales bacterium]
GGTGLYVRALLRGLFEAPPVDDEIRAAHEREAEQHGVDALYARLQAVDPETAANVQPADFVRISRALEVYEQSGETISALRARHGFAEARYDYVMWGLDPGREVLRARIEARVDEMMAQGWLDEVRALIAAGAAESHPMGALGYRHLRAHLSGELDLAEAVRQTKRDTWRFARRQLNWFRHEGDVRWFASADEVSADGADDPLPAAAT